MSEANFNFLPDMSLAADRRRIAAELSHSYFLMQCSRNALSQEQEVGYAPAVPDDFGEVRAKAITDAFLRWYVADPTDGLVANTANQESFEAVSSLGDVLDSNEILLIMDVNKVEAKLDHAARVSNDTDTNTAANNRALVLGIMICRDLCDEDPDGIKTAMTWSLSDPAVYHKLGEALQTN